MNEAEMLKQGKIGVLPTDTIYGIVASALNEEAIARVYEVKGRATTKKTIILISSLDDLRAFGVILTEGQQKNLNRFWPGPVSIIVPGDIAFRIPDDPSLIAFLKESGPVIAPSANPEGLPPAETIEEAKKYFGNMVDFYIDGGKRVGEPSTLIRLEENGAMTVLRQGGKSVV